MSLTTQLGIASSYIAKTSNIQGDFGVSGDAKLYGGLVGTYLSTTSTTPSLTSGTALFLNCSGGTTANCTFSSPITGQAVFIANNNSGDVTLGDFYVSTGHGGLAVYNGSAWVKFLAV